MANPEALHRHLYQLDPTDGSEQNLASDHISGDIPTMREPAAKNETAYTCPIHPEVVSEERGDCPILTDLAGLSEAKIVK